MDSFSGKERCSCNEKISSCQPDTSLVLSSPISSLSHNISSSFSLNEIIFGQSDYSSDSSQWYLLFFIYVCFGSETTTTTTTSSFTNNFGCSPEALDEGMTPLKRFKHSKGYSFSTTTATVHCSSVSHSSSGKSTLQNKVVLEDYASENRENAQA